MWYCFMRGLSIREAHAEMAQVYGAETPATSTIGEWFSRFAAGRETFGDNPRSGRPALVGAADTVAAVLRDEPYASARSIATAVGLSKDTVISILKCQLGLQNFHLKWVPHQLSAEQKATRVERANFLFCTSWLACLHVVCLMSSPVMNRGSPTTYHTKHDGQGRAVKRVSG